MELNKIKIFVIEKHKGQLRKQGIPYYLHPFEVARKLKEKGFDINYQVAGLFHDLIEDTDTTYEDILQISNKEIADVVKLVSKEDGYIMKDYIQRISENEMAKMLKLADRVSNLEDILKIVDNEFKLKYIKSTEKWYLDLAKGTIFEKEMKEQFHLVKQSLAQDRLEKIRKEKKKSVHER